MKLLHSILELLFPSKCILCGKLLQRQESDLCHSCRAETEEFGTPHFSISFLAQWTALWYYDGSVRESLLRYKFSNRRSYAAAYGRLLAMQLLPLREQFDLLTWVPISKRRRRSRGYDQVELLARAVGKELGIVPVRLLIKTRHNPPQSGITGHAQRKANVLGAYRVCTSVAGKRILLLDDIITTGATAGECGRVLLTAGAKEVICAAVAAARHEKQAASKVPSR